MIKHKTLQSWLVINSSIDKKNSSRDVWADSAYSSKEKREALKEKGFRGRIQCKGYRNKKLSDFQIACNHKRAKIRCRVEHVFGVQAMRAGSLIIRTIGIVRAKAKIGLRNLAYNIDKVLPAGQGLAARGAATRLKSPQKPIDSKAFC